jgi:shikimate kinase
LIFFKKKEVQNNIEPSYKIGSGGGKQSRTERFRSLQKSQQFVYVLLQARTLVRQRQNESRFQEQSELKSFRTGLQARTLVRQRQT